MTLLTVKNITGDSIYINFVGDIDVNDLKNLIANKINLMPCLFILLCDGKELQDISQIKSDSKLNYILKLNPKEKLIEYLRNKYGHYIIITDPFHLDFLETDLHDNINMILYILSNDLEGLTLNHCKLKGLIPTNLYKLKNLVNLCISDNELSGTISENIGNLSCLENMTLINCGLYGKIPDGVFKLTNLKILCLSGNKLTGQLSEKIGNLKKLKVLELKSNQLTGHVPENILNLNNLEELLLDFNKFEGTFPSNIEKLNNLRILCINHYLIGEEHIKKIDQLNKPILVCINKNCIDNDFYLDLCYEFVFYFYRHPLYSKYQQEILDNIKRINEDEEYKNYCKILVFT